MPTLTREQMALEALTLLLDLADHKEVCIAVQRNMRDFCEWEKKKSARYAELIDLIYSGRNRRKRVKESIECPTNVWFDNAALERARARNGTLAGPDNT